MRSSAKRWRYALTLSISGSALLVWSIFVQWRHPRCSLANDGPVDFWYGFPLPWLKPSGFSLEWAFTPTTLALNFLLLLAILTPLALWIERLTRPWHPRARLALATCVVVPSILLTAFETVLIGSGLVFPVSSLGFEDSTLWDARPAGLLSIFNLHKFDECNA